MSSEAEFFTRLHSFARIRRELIWRGFIWGAATATGVHLLVALWVRAGAM